MEGYFRIEPLGVLSRNIITTQGRDSFITATIDNVGPNWSYIAVGTGTAAPGSAQTALETELHREEVSTAWSPQAGTARLLTVYGPYWANGDWNEVGIFDTEAVREVVSTCEGTAGWSSDGTLSQETSVVHQGQASLRSQMTTAGTIAFENSSLSPSPGTASIGSADYFQFWYRTSEDVGQLTVRLGDSSTEYIQWSWTPGTTDAWALFHKQLDEGSYSGTPTDWTYFRLTHAAQGTAFDEYLDYLSLFSKQGQMMCRGTVDVTKNWNTVWNVYYSLKIP